MNISKFLNTFISYILAEPTSSTKRQIQCKTYNYLDFSFNACSNVMWENVTQKYQS